MRATLTIFLASFLERGLKINTEKVRLEEENDNDSTENKDSRETLDYSKKHTGTWKERNLLEVKRQKISKDENNQRSNKEKMKKNNVIGKQGPVEKTDSHIIEKEDTQSDQYHDITKSIKNDDNRVVVDDEEEPNDGHANIDILLPKKKVREENGNNANKIKESKSHDGVEDCENEKCS